jgi:hypothetical protein
VIDRHRAWSWLDSPASQDRPYGLTNGENAVLFSALFLATVGVGLVGATFSSVGAFVLGMCWMLVLGAVSEWEKRVDRRDVTMISVDPAASSARKASFETYRADHDLKDLATLPCQYGCRNPVPCSFAHRGCTHCQAARAGDSDAR